jgi:DNA topoisomerase-1
LSHEGLIPQLKLKIGGNLQQELELKHRKHAKQAGLLYVTADQPGIRRLKQGKGFRYLSSTGRPVRDLQTLKRIRKLAIPPAYRDVWIAPQAKAHLQVIGKDARGRKQYRYHADWRARKDDFKYDQMMAFAKALPRIRATTAEDLKQPGIPKTKVLAAVVQLLEKTLIRVGNDEYARENQSFGLSTLLDQHVQVGSSKVVFKFKGKSNIKHEISLVDPVLAKVVKKCRDLPGQLLFQYEDEKGATHKIHSQDVNQYLKDITHQSFTAKDFRTWGGTVFAALTLREFKPARSTAEAKRNLNQAIETVAKKLGNTKAICRKCYIHPAVMNAFLNGEVIRSLTRRKHPLTADELHLDLQDEKKVLNFLKKRAKELTHSR